MAKFDLKSMTAKLEARKLGERVVLFGFFILLLVSGWLTLFHDPAAAARAGLERRIAVSQGQIAEELARQAGIESSYTNDPNAFAVNRLRELRAATTRSDARLTELYGELISPQQMARVLTTILQRETALKLISLENRPPESLLTTSVLASPGADSANVQVFRHGLRMVFEGSFLETIDYLRNLENLETSFFWDNLQFTLGTWPNGQISLDIYTLSTQRGWIGV